MEFKAIVDAKRVKARIAPLWAFTSKATWGQCRHVDEQIGGVISKLHAGGDFAGKARRLPVAALDHRCTVRARTADRPGARATFGRKQYRKALLQPAAQALAKTGATDAVVYLTLEDIADLDVLYRARMVAEVFSVHAYKIPDLKTGTKPKASRLSTVSVATDARAAKSAADGLAAGVAIGNGWRWPAILGNLPPNLHAHLPGSRALQLAKQFPSIKTKVLDEAGIKALKMGAFLAVTQGSDQPPRLIVCEYRGAKKSALRYASSAKASPSTPAAFR
jgi:leucyl aminopeptidase